MNKQKPKRIAALGITLGLAAPLTLAHQAVASPEAAPSEEVDAILSEVVDDALFRTTKALEEAGVLGVNSAHAGLTLEIEKVSDDEIVIRYYPGGTNASKLEALVEEARQSSPMRFTLEQVEVNPGKAEALALEISEGEPEWLERLAIPDVSAVWVDGETGHLVVETSAPMKREELVIEGIPATILGGADIELQSRSVDSKP